MKRFNIQANVPFLTNKPDTISSRWYRAILALFQGDKSIQVVVTGFSVTVANGIGILILNPAGVLATGTVIMPAGAGEGDRLIITSTQTITALTVTANKGQTVSNAPTALTVSATAPYGYEFVFDSDAATWYRIQ